MVQVQDIIATADEPRIIHGRMSIGHLLLITISSAVAIWLQHPPGTARSGVYVGIAAVFAPAYGCAMAALALNVLQLVRHGRYFATQPGHWLLVAVGLLFSGIALLARCAQVGRDYAPPDGAVMAMLSAGLVFSVWGLVLPIVAAREVSEGSWKTVFGVMGAALPALLLGAFCGGLVGGPIGPFLAVCIVPGCIFTCLLVVIGTAVLGDQRRQEQRDLWHWLGVGTLTACVVHLAVLALAVVSLSKP